MKSIYFGLKVMIIVIASLFIAFSLTPVTVGFPTVVIGIIFRLYSGYDAFFVAWLFGLVLIPLTYVISAYIFAKVFTNDRFRDSMMLALVIPGIPVLIFFAWFLLRI